MTTHFIVHDKADTVGVMVVENIQAGQELTGWIMETDETVKVKSEDAIPLGHKIAMRNISKGETVLKYGNDVGRAVAEIGKGHHVHIHNMRTKRW
jgi:(2R)-sulfolactate sulfo-lyase subunit alpha